MIHLLIVLAILYLLLTFVVYLDALREWSNCPEDGPIIHFLAILFALTWPYQVIDWLLSRRGRK